jgi:hypothetical protein
MHSQYNFNQIIRMQTAGVILATFGSLVAYVVYITFKGFEAGETPVLTHMYGEWLFVGGMTTGLGTTLISIGVFSIALAEREWLHHFDMSHGGNESERVFWIVILQQICLWVSITTSNPPNVEGNFYLDWIHVFASGTLMFIHAYAQWECFRFILHAIQHLEHVEKAQQLSYDPVSIANLKSLVTASNYVLCIFIPVCGVVAIIGVFTSWNLFVVVPEMLYLVFLGCMYFVLLYSFQSLLQKHDQTIVKHGQIR